MGQACFRLQHAERKAARQHVVRIDHASLCNGEAQRGGGKHLIMDDSSDMNLVQVLWPFRFNQLRPASFGTLNNEISAQIVLPPVPA